MGAKVTKDEFIKRARIKYGDKYDYSQVDLSGGMHSKVKIVCPKHGEFHQTATTHISSFVSCGCPKCAVETVAKQHAFTQDEFIAKCKEVWGDTYDLSKVEYINCMSKITVICPTHGEFKITPNDFLSHHGCRKCAGTYQPTSEEFKQRIYEKHGDLYDLSQAEYVNSVTPIRVFCRAINPRTGKEFGEFWIKPILLTQMKDGGLPKCFKNYRKTTEEFIDDARKIFGDEYDYSQVDYQGNKKKVTIICKKHGPFQMKPNSHLGGQKCPLCYEDRRGDTTRKTQEQFISEIDAIYKKMGKYYDYSMVRYVNNSTPVTLICPEHGKFDIAPDKILSRGDSCRWCHQSKIECETKEFLKQHNILFEEQKKFEWLKHKSQMSLDFYLPEYNVGIECQGIQHFKQMIAWGSAERAQLKEVLTRDEKKYKQCSKEGITLLYYANEKDFQNATKEATKLYTYDNLFFDLNTLLTKIQEKKNDTFS